MASGLFRKTNCPSCSEENSLRISRSRNSKERIIQLIPFIEIYRCRKCGWRGWKFDLSLNKVILKKIIVYVLLALIAAFVVYNLLKLVV